MKRATLERYLATPEIEDAQRAPPRNLVGNFCRHSAAFYPALVEARHGKSARLRDTVRLGRRGATEIRLLRLAMRRSILRFVLHWNRAAACVASPTIATKVVGDPPLRLGTSHGTAAWPRRSSPQAPGRSSLRRARTPLVSQNCFFSLGTLAAWSAVRRVLEAEPRARAVYGARGRGKSRDATQRKYSARVAPCGSAATRTVEERGRRIWGSTSIRTRAAVVRPVMPPIVF